MDFSILEFDFQDNKKSECVVFYAMLLILWYLIVVYLFLLQMATYLGFAAELYAWFVVGEVIGRGGSLTGYQI